uniref:Uncharacterized protein n=1 Tax=Cucumis melo TaxID=3656 RepID=A0A9I9EG74_CUCME
MSVLYRDFRCSLHKSYKSYKKYDSPAEARKHRDNEWHDIWIGLVYVIDGSEKTLRVDLKQILRHDLNFHSPIEKEEGKEDEMVELKTTSSQEGSEPLLEREICERVLGKRSGNVKGQGWGPRPKNARNETIQHNTKEVNAQIAHL